MFLRLAVCTELKFFASALSALLFCLGRLEKDQPYDGTFLNLIRGCKLYASFLMLCDGIARSVRCRVLPLWG
jgi:hypothetical protein